MENARARIVEHAAALFAEKGYETASLADLAKRLGLTKPAFYNYFPSKRDLLDAVILETLAGLVAAVRAAVAAQEGPALRLQAFMTAHARYFAAHRDGFATMLVGFSGMENLEFRADAIALRHEHEQMLKDILGSGVRSGAFRDFDPSLGTRAILSMLNWMVRWYRPDGPLGAGDLALEYYRFIAIERAT